MPHATLTVRVNHTFKGARHTVGEVYEFEGTKEELRELVDGGLVETDVTLGKATIAADVRKYRDKAALEEKARIERDATIAEQDKVIERLTEENTGLLSKVSDLETEIATYSELGAEIRKALNIGDDTPILTAVKDLAKKAAKVSETK